MKKITSILLLGAENIIALSIIRSLGAVLPKAKIHTLSPLDKKKSVPERSKYISSHHYFSSWEDDFHHHLTEKIEETQADLVLPVGDVAVRVLSTLKSDLEGKVYLPPLPKLDTYYQLERKDQLADLLSLNDFPNAQTWLLDTIDVNKLEEYQFPLLLKPINGSSGLGIKKINNKKSLAQVLSRIEKEKYILQEIIAGQDIGCSILAVDGDIKAHTIQKVLGHKGFGVATAIRFIENDTVLEQTRRLVELTGYSGVAHLDYRLDERDGQPKLVDFNARFWFSLLGSKAAGVDFTLLCCLTAIGIPFNRPDYQKITYYAGMNTLRYYFRKILSLGKKSYLTDTSVYTDLRDRLIDPMPELARYIQIPQKH